LADESKEHDALMMEDFYYIMAFGLHWTGRNGLYTAGAIIAMGGSLYILLVGTVIHGVGK
jgi:hypothetical protein